MRFCNPIHCAMRAAGFALGFASGFYVFAAQAQGIQLLQDTETERVLRSYEDPILGVAGLDPQAVKMYIVNDQTINAFAAEGQNIFVNTGLFIQLKTPKRTHRRARA